MTYDSVVLADSPAVYLKLDEASGTTATDSSGNGRNATIPSANVSYSQRSLASGLGSSIRLTSGVSASINIPYSTGFINSTSFSLEMWVLPENWSSGSPLGLWDLNNERLIVRKGDGGHGNNYQVGADSSSQAGTSDIYDPGATTNGQPKHVVITYNSTTGATKIYVNGVVKGSTITLSTGGFSWGTGSTLAVLANQPNNRITQGYVSNVAVYASELSGAQITAHFNAAHQNYDAEVLALSPKLFYKLDELSGTIATDVGSLQKDGAFSGTPTPDQSSLYTGGTKATRFASGDSAYISATGLSTMDSWSAYTFCGWWKATDQTTDPFLMTMGWSGGSSIPISIGTNGGGSTFKIGAFDGSSWNYATGSTTIASNGIYFVAATLSAKTSGMLTLYVDGLQEAQATGITFGSSWTQSTLYIGHQWDSGNMSTGVFQGMAAFDSALTSGQIATLFSGPPPSLFRPTLQPIRRSVPVQHRSRRY